MHDRRSEIRGRLRRLVDQHVRPAERRHVADLAVGAWHVPPAADGTVGEPVPFAAAKAQTYEPFEIGDPWGPAWATTWFRLTGEVPADVNHAELVVDLGFQGNMAGFQAEGLVHRPDGTHYYTGSTIDRRPNLHRTDDDLRPARPPGTTTTAA